MMISTQRKLIRFFLMAYIIGLILYGSVNKIDSGYFPKQIDQLVDEKCAQIQTYFSINKTEEEIIRICQPPFERINLCLIGCGERMDETLNAMKSAIALSYSPLSIFLFSEKHIENAAKIWISTWPIDVSERVTVEFRNITYPENEKFVKYNNKSLSRFSCTNQKLFLSALLKDTNFTIFTDADVIFMTPLEDLWRHHNYFNSSQVIAMVPEHEPNSKKYWYKEGYTVPFYGKKGLNGGVILMNLLRLRNLDFEQDIMNIIDEYKEKIVLHDQDVLNIYFHFHPDRLYLLNCQYNLRTDHCRPGGTCIPKDAGRFVLHGSRKVFLNPKLNHLYGNIYLLWSKYILGEDLHEDLFVKMQYSVSQVKDIVCPSIYDPLMNILINMARHKLINSSLLLV